MGNTTKQAFKRAIAQFALIKAIIELPEAMRAAALANVGPYISRGKGRSQHFIKQVALRVHKMGAFHPFKNGNLQNANGIIIPPAIEEWNKVQEAEKQAQKALQASNKEAKVRRYQQGGLIFSKGL